MTKQIFLFLLIKLTILISPILAQKHPYHPKTHPVLLKLTKNPHLAPACPACRQAGGRQAPSAQFFIWKKRQKYGILLLYIIYINGELAERFKAHPC